MYEVILDDEADDFFQRASPPLARKLGRCFRQLEQTPRRHSNIKRLAGPFHGYLRYRVGDYRVIYRIEEAAKQVRVVDIAHRRESYD